MTDASLPPPGALLGGRYRLARVIGAGGMGVVYEASDTTGGSKVAIKILRKELLEGGPFTERLKREARAIASLEHPNIVQVVEVEVTPERAFLVMELLEGESLGARLRESGPLSATEATEVATGILAGLVAAHDAGFVHRDVKPDNVFLANERGERVVKLLDFGLVKSTVGTQPLTATGTVLGTFQYMAPEQAHGQDVDGRADVYSLGACLYYALSGKRPCQAADMEAAMFALTDLPAPPLADLRRDLDPRLCRAVESALSKSRLGRPTARELLATFEGLAAARAGSVTKLRAHSATVDDEEMTTERGGTPEAESVPTTEVAPASTLSAPEPTLTATPVLDIGAAPRSPQESTAPFVRPPVAAPATARLEEIVAPRTVPLRLAPEARPTPARVPSARRARRVDARVTMFFVIAFVLFGVGILVGRAFVFP